MGCKRNRVMEYNTASVTDIARIIDLKLEMFRESGHDNLLHPDARTIIAADYASLYAKGLACHFVARSDGVIIACAGAFIKTDIPYRYYLQPQYGWIGDVFVDVHFRGRGIATQLSQAALKWLSGTGVTTVRLLASTAARPIYAKLGFELTDEMVLHI